VLVVEVMNSIDDTGLQFTLINFFQNNFQSINRLNEKAPLEKGAEDAHEK
jgi:hypothetical protein